MTQSFDVVVVGGGPAGLSGALALSRARRTVLVVDNGEPRNAPAAGVHNYLTRDGVPPAEFAEIGRSEVKSYGGEIVDGKVTTLNRLADSQFAVTLDDGRTVEARRILVATGGVDHLPDIPGLAERWGTDVIHCPYCHGWEVRDQRIGVLATSPAAVFAAQHWRQWSPRVTLFAHEGPVPSPEELDRLSARDIPVVEGRVVGLEVEADRLTGVQLDNGGLVACDALVVAAPVRARSELLEQLGIEPVDTEVHGVVMGINIPSQPPGVTEVAGVWVAGNVTSPFDQVIGAAAAGVHAGAAINADLVAEDVERAVSEQS